MCCCVLLPKYLCIPSLTRFTLPKPQTSLISNHRYTAAPNLVSARLEYNGLGVNSSKSTSFGSGEVGELYGELEFEQKQLEEEESLLKSGRMEWGAISRGDDGTNKVTDQEEEEDIVKRSSGGSESDVGIGGLKIRESDDKLNLQRGGRQLMRRSKLFAKQVISLHSALTLGFVSQLWVDTNSWMVLIVEVRPSLLSGEFERFLLDDISRVGDVVLIEDESVMENDHKMVGLDTLVGYNVVTPGRRNIGRVRGFMFDINSGAVELLELDSFGISLIPSSLVSIYALFVEDILEVVSDTVVVHEAAVSRIQRLTKGFWDDHKKVGGKSIEEQDEEEYFYDLKTELPSESSDYVRARKRSRRRKSSSKSRETPDEWELPMDFL